MATTLIRTGERPHVKVPGAGEAADEGGVGGGADAVGDPPRLQPAEGLGDGAGAAGLAGVDHRGEAEPREAAVDGGEIPGGKGQLVAPETEADGPRPGVAGVEVEDPVRRVGAEVPDGVQEDADASRPASLVGREGRLDGVADGPPFQPEPLDDGRGDVDLGVDDPLRAEPGRQVAGEEAEVGGLAQEAADVSVEGEEPGETLEAAPGPDRGDVRKEGRAGPPGEADEGRRPDGPFEVEVELGLRPEADGTEEVFGSHGGGSYGTWRPSARACVPPDRLWLRAAAFGLDLICLAGGPLLVATVVVFLVVVVAAEPPAGLPWVFRAAQLVFLALFLLRDALGTSPGKTLLGLSVQRLDGGRVRPFDSVLRNLPLLVPGLNLLEAAAVVRRPDSRRLGDRLAGTTVGES